MPDVRRSEVFRDSNTRWLSNSGPRSFPCCLHTYTEVGSVISVITQLAFVLEAADFAVGVERLSVWVEVKLIRIQ